MNREIKFRVWNGKEMLDWEKAWNTECKLPEQFGEDKWLSLAIIAMMARGNGNLTALQYTGLKDKNGKEIYEGDIVKWTDPFSTHIIEVFYDEFDGGFKLNVSYHTCGFRHILQEKLEILGNIYENLELLKN